MGCLKLDRDTFSKEETKELLQDYILGKVNVAEDEETGIQFEVGMLPTLLFLRPNGEEIWRTEGYVTYEELAQVVKRVREMAGGG